MIVLIGMSGWRKSLEQEDCIGIRHTQAHNIAKQLRIRGVEVVYCDVGSPAMDYEASVDYYAKLPIPAADHAIVVEPVAFSTRVFDDQWEQIYPGTPYPRKRVGKCPFLDALREKVPGCISTIANSHCIGLGMEDITFFQYTAEKWVRDAPHVRKIGWAADGDLFRPCQKGTPIRVLLDHPHYIPSERDDTDLLVASLRGVPVEVVRLGKTDLEEIDPAAFTDGKRYNSGIPQPRLAEIHRGAHVFCTTHVESQGLSVLEAAMCGSLIVSRKGHIRPVLLDPLEHLVYDAAPDWDDVLAMVNPLRCRERALPFTRWDDIGQIIYDTFVGWTC